MPIIRGYPNIVSYETTQKIVDQMRKNICQIQSDESQGTGFLCKIPFHDINNMLPVLITNNHIINEEFLYEKGASISIYTEDNKSTKTINLNDRIKYTNKTFGITIIEIKEEDKINNYLELDNNILDDILNKNNTNKEYIDETVYLLHYPEGVLSVSYGVLSNIYEEKGYMFTHMCSTIGGSSGSPVLNLITNKVIGIHHSGISKKNVCQGILLNEPIKDFIKVKQNKPEFTLKDLNKKYNLNIKDLNVDKLDLRWKKLGNEGLVDLCKFKFKFLKELILNNNNITDIKPLEKAKFEKLEILDLSQNKISDINIFKNVGFQGLRQLYLGYNNISDIKIFGKEIFEDLEILSLNDNKIDKSKDAAIISNLKSKIGIVDV